MAQPESSGPEPAWWTWSAVSGRRIPTPDLCSGASPCLAPHHCSFSLPTLSPSPAPGGQPLHASRPASPPQLFLKEHLHQLLESMRERVLHLAALTLQRCLRGFLIRRRFRSLRHKIILLQSRARGYLARYNPRRAGLAGASEEDLPELGYKLPVPEVCELSVGASLQEGCPDSAFGCPAHLPPGPSLHPGSGSPGTTT